MRRSSSSFTETLVLDCERKRKKERKKKEECLVLLRFITKGLSYNFYKVSGLPPFPRNLGPRLCKHRYLDYS